MKKSDTTTDIKEKAYALGYDLCGIIPADSLSEYTAFLDKRVERFPQSRHLYEQLYALGSPEKKEAWAKSIVVCVRRYNKYKIPADADRYFGKLYLFDRRLPYTEGYKSAALFEEYIQGKGMQCFKDSTAARLAAVKAGLGHFGKNNFLYTRYGSWVTVDTWTVSAELDYDGPQEVSSACPPNCTTCIDACPTRAMAGPYAMDRGLCIAQQSFFSTDLPEEQVREQMGTWLYGCDVCQDVCPKNRGLWKEEQEFPRLNSLTGLLTPDKIAEMDEQRYLETIQPRFWYIGKESIWLWKSNAIRAMANSNDSRYHPYIRQACQDRDPKIKSMADWARRKLGI